MLAALDAGCARHAYVGPVAGAGFAVAARTSADRRASRANPSPAAGSTASTTMAVGPAGLAIPADLGRLGVVSSGGRAGGAVGAAGPASGPRALSLSELLEGVRSGQVHNAMVDDAAHLVRGQLRDGAAYQAAYPPGFAPERTVRLHDAT